MIAVVGVDLGLRKAHFFGIHDHGGVDLFDVTISSRTIRILRSIELKEIHSRVKEYYSGVTCPFFVEEPVVAGARNMRVSLGIAQTSGAVISAIRGSSYLIPVSSWKKETIGKGNATKEDVKAWLFDNKKPYSVACERTNSPQDYSDAACIAVYGSKMLGLDL